MRQGGDRRQKSQKDGQVITLPETNIAPENGWLEYDRFLWGWPIFRDYVSFREGTSHKKKNIIENQTAEKNH